MPAGNAAPIHASSFLIVFGLSEPVIMPTKNPPSTVKPYESHVVSTPALSTVAIARNAAQNTVVRAGNTSGPPASRSVAGRRARKNRSAAAR
jgi:hypothetical protein